jgi:hypothetical protein
MLYVGYPITYETMQRLFHLDDSTHWKDVPQIIAKSGLEFHSIDKGLCILGLSVKEVISYSAATYCSADDSIVAIMNTKKKVTELVEKAGLDISELEIAFMEEESFLAKNPQPYVITF